MPISPGSGKNRDQCLPLVPVRAARAPWGIGPSSVGGIGPGSCQEPGPKLQSRTTWHAAELWSRFVARTGTNTPPLSINNPPPLFSPLFFLVGLVGSGCQFFFLCHAQDVFDEMLEPHLSSHKMISSAEVSNFILFVCN